MGRVGAPLVRKRARKRPCRSRRRRHRLCTNSKRHVLLKYRFHLSLYSVFYTLVVNRCAVCLSLQRGVFDAVFCFFNAFSFLRKRDLNVFARWQENSGVEVMTSSKFCITRHALRS